MCERARARARKRERARARESERARERESESERDRDKGAASASGVIRRGPRKVRDRHRGDSEAPAGNNFPEGSEREKESERD